MCVLNGLLHKYISHHYSSDTYSYKAEVICAIIIGLTRLERGREEGGGRRSGAAVGVVTG